MFYGLKFGEKCDKHPPMKTRGADTRTQIFHQIQPTDRRNASIRQQSSTAQGNSNGQQQQQQQQYRDPGYIPNAAPGSRLQQGTPRQQQQQRFGSDDGGSFFNGGSNAMGQQHQPPGRRRPSSASSTASSNNILAHGDSGLQQPAALPKHPKKRTEYKLAECFALPSAKTEKELFSRLDFNGNGMLSLAELDKAVVELWPKFNNKPAIMRAYKAADANGSGFVSKGEFHLFIVFLTFFQNLWETFEKIDTSGDRRLSLDEFVDAAEMMYLNKREAQQVFQQIDTNGGGFVLFDEFCSHFAAEKVEEERAKLPPPKPKTPKLKQAKVLQLPSQTESVKLFNRLDFNGNGMLSLAELDKAVVELWPKFNNKPAIMRAYKATDANGSGYLSKREFKYFLQFLVVYQNLWEEFMLLDEDTDRRITLPEFLKHAPQTQMFKNKSEDELTKEFSKMDRNGGGVLLFDEFCAEYATLALKRYAQEQHEAAAKHGGRDPGVPPPLMCPCCGKVTTDHSHFEKCRKQLQAHIDSLPSYLAKDIVDMPMLPDPRTPAEIQRYNAIAKDVYARNSTFVCPECKKKFSAAHIGGHWKTHKITYNRKMELIKQKKEPTFRPKVEDLPEHDTDIELAALKRKLVSPFDISKLNLLRRQLCLERNTNATISQEKFIKLLASCGSISLQRKALLAIFKAHPTASINDLLEGLETADEQLVAKAAQAFDALDTDKDSSVPFKKLKEAIKAQPGRTEAERLQYICAFERPLEKHVSRQEFVKKFLDLSVVFDEAMCSSLLNFEGATSNYSAVVLITAVSGVQKTLELKSATPMKLDSKSLMRRLALHGITDVQRIELVK